ncbi:N-acetylated-alpha-linked acidic dipeptidase 2-like isoform X4 [Orbicella faveolata]|nr:N-acetylated-alpha-linked acidic dipeptidase 2-like isoform X4 [Orbicella faveolata]XP_020630250.1 N-acetylated-alpha-linked acidic dipeptidase 2-like isoform X4 [Orbicella faveolata]XP_020630258.1 N-acetylated-alpha-linked acidic dipeptidase 2-like isoform X4 [Orbicella faveolata]XP_020630264.1 N-acetylated-alpha-linked acidic dipeptidase 2-like isoform X4 [Orbicella faveolata]XP_020630272.1 N-acetylated-alpha-linked acidic dipeptidase 2-like isoform X4 [Orbicella faveolata]
MVRYDVLLSMPPRDKPNVVKILNTTDGSVLWNVEGPEKIAEPSENDSLVLPPFLGYSPPGVVQAADLLYANYGTVDDFKELEKRNLNCTGNIVIMRYGKIFRGNKVQNAEKRGAAGALLYSDPADYSPEGMNNTFPKTWWLPGTGTQRGNIWFSDGDPLTPLLPSIDGVYRITRNDTDVLPNIPAQVMTYDDAVEFLKRLKGDQVPPEWAGGLNIVYRFGPGFIDSELKVRLEVNNQFVTKPIFNVIGTILGKEEPDRLVLMGNHRDAWVFGGVDPSSGTAVMMEASRGIGELLTNTDWRPRRTIVFCSWGAEESGLIGSYEWVEENRNMLRDRAVMYLNVDSAVKGNYSFGANGNPGLKSLVFQESAFVKDPNAHDKEASLYDHWSIKTPSSTEPGKPHFGTLGAGSDYVPFSHFIGVPSIDMSYRFKSMNRTLYPVYHTVHDTFYWQKTFNDPHFTIHLSMSQIGARIVLEAADTPILPYNLLDYKEALERNFEALKSFSKSLLLQGNVTLDHLANQIKQFSRNADAFEKRKAEARDTQDFAKLRILNDQMMNMERAFIWPLGLPGRQLLRHVLFAPQMHNNYGSSSFPGITDALFDIEKTNDWKLVKEQVSIALTCVREAGKILALMD